MMDAAQGGVMLGVTWCDAAQEGVMLSEELWDKHAVCMYMCVFAYACAYLMLACKRAPIAACALSALLHPVQLTALLHPCC